MILDLEELVSVLDFLCGCRKIKKFMLDKEFFVLVLVFYVNLMIEYKSIEEEINFLIKGNSIDVVVSKELKWIWNNIDFVDGKIKECLMKFLNSSVNKKFI